MSLKEALDELGVEEDSELGQAFKKLDECYAKGEAIKKTILKLKREHKKLKEAYDQNQEDAELMEMLLMHRFNKDTRLQRVMRK